MDTRGNENLARQGGLLHDPSVMDGMAILANWHVVGRSCCGPGPRVTGWACNCALQIVATAGTQDKCLTHLRLCWTHLDSPAYTRKHFAAQGSIGPNKRSIQSGFHLNEFTNWLLKGNVEQLAGPSEYKPNQHKAPHLLRHLYDSAVYLQCLLNASVSVPCTQHLGMYRVNR